jgi:hypothetical protein
MVKTAIAGTSKLSKTAKTKRSEKEKKNTAEVLTVPLAVPFKNKTMGRKKRKSGPITGTKTAAKTNKKIAGSSLEKG